MASHPEEALEQSSSATTATTSQLQQPGQWTAAAEAHCTICLGEMNNIAYVNGCFHAFCFSCIQQWATMRPACPLCRRPFDRILHTVQADDIYKQYVVSSSARQRRTTARQRMVSRAPQRHYNLRPRTTNSEPTTWRRGPGGRLQGTRDNAAPGYSNNSAQQAAEERLAGPAGALTLSNNLLAPRVRLFNFLQSPQR